MKKIVLLYLLLVSMLSARSQIIINELQADAGNNEGVGGDWVEFKNIGSTPVDMSCWRFSNGGSVILSIPNGLILQSGHYLLVGNAAKVMCANCDYPSLNLQFTLNADGFGQGTGNYATTTFLNTDLSINGGCGCMTGTGNYNNGNGTGDRLVLFNELGVIQDAMMYANGNNYGITSLTANFVGTLTCPAASYILPATTDTIYNGRTICNDLSGCNSSFARLPDGNNLSNVVYDQTGNLACTNCLVPCAVGALNTASTDNPTPGLSNQLSASTMLASIDGLPFAGIDTSFTVCGATPITFQYTINHFTNVALTATQASGNLGSYSMTNSGTPSNFASTGFNTATGVSTLQSTVTPPNGTSVYEFVWGDNNGLCTSCPGSISTSTPSTPSSTAKECYVSRKMTIIRENPLGGTPSASCSTPGTINVNGASGTNLLYTLQKQITTGGSFTTVAGPFASNIIAGIIDDDADPTLPNYQVLVSSNNTVCVNPAPLVVTVPIGCLGNPACPKYVTSGTGLPTFLPPPALAPVCANSNVTFTVDIKGVCTTGQLEVLYDYSPSFDPYTSGTSLGVTGTSVGATPPQTIASSKVFINEFVVRPAQNTCPFSPDGGGNPNSGEWLELYNPGPTSVDISGWIVADGDWTATIPAGTIMASNSFYLIGGGGTFCSSGTMPDLNIETCNCAGLISGSDMMNLTNGAEQLALYDCSGTYIDGVLWGGGQGLPDNSQNNAPASGCGNYIPAKSVNLPVAASFQNSGTISSPNSGKYRTNTNTWVTSTTTTISPKASNPGGEWNGASLAFGTQCPPPPVTANITVTLPDTCSQTNSTLVTLKAIYKPQPTAPCSTNDVTATATYLIPACELMTLSGNGDYCEPSTAPVTLNVSAALAGNYTVNLGNGTNTQSIGPITGAGPFNDAVANSGTWTITSIQAPVGVCPPKKSGSAIIQINPIPAITNSPLNGSFCNGLGFDLSSVEPSIVTTPPTSQFNWYDEASGGLPISTFVNPLSTDTFYVSASSGPPANCESSTRTAFILNVDPVPLDSGIILTGAAVTFYPPNPNCSPVPCAGGVEYSADGINWGFGPSFTATDPGWSGFGSPTNNIVFRRNANAPSCFINTTYFLFSTPLPTQLFSFLGINKKDGSNELIWKTAQEKNVSHFEIERSSNKLNFVKMGSVRAAGNTASVTDYHYQDIHPLSGDNYYRLKMIDVDEHFAYSNIIMVKADTKESAITALYPNPVSNEMNLELYGVKAEKTNVQIIDMLGKIVMDLPILIEKGVSTKKINLQALAKGQYTVRIRWAQSAQIRMFSKE